MIILYLATSVKSFNHRLTTRHVQLNDCGNKSIHKIKSLLTVFNNNKVNMLCNNEDRTIPIGHVATSEICLWRI